MVKNYKNDKNWQNLKVTLTKYKHVFFWSCYQNQKVFFPPIQTTTKFGYLIPLRCKTIPGIS